MNRKFKRNIVTLINVLHLNKSVNFFKKKKHIDPKHLKAICSYGPNTESNLYKLIKYRCPHT